MSMTGRLMGVSDEAGASIAEQITVHQRLGWRRLELRSVDGIAIAALASAAREDVCAQIREAGFEVPVLASRIGNWQSSIADSPDKDWQELDNLVVWSEALGSKQIRVMSYINDGRPEAEWRDEVFRRLRNLARRAAESDLTLIHENCSGWGGQNIKCQLQLLDGVGEANLKLLFDLGNGLSYGYDAHEMLERSLPHIVHVHLKDGVRNPQDGSVSYTFPGEGEAGMAQCIARLSQAGYTGLFSIEPHLDLIPHLHSRKGNVVQMQDNYVRYARIAAAMLAQHDGVANAI